MTGLPGLASNEGRGFYGFASRRPCGLIRPSGATAAASVITNPAPPTARLPRWTRCQSLANPLVLEYSHLGETTMRLGRVTFRIGRGSNKLEISLLLFGCYLVQQAPFSRIRTRAKRGLLFACRLSHSRLQPVRLRARQTGRVAASTDIPRAAPLPADIE
jgi:hypothetical protein